MATEQDTSTPEATLRPQTPAARRRNPGASQARTPEERERLREESRARRKARAEGRVIAPEPPAGEITLRRLASAPAEAPPNPQPATPPKPQPATPAARTAAPPPALPGADELAPALPDFDELAPALPEVEEQLPPAPAPESQRFVRPQPEASGPAAAASTDGAAAPPLRPSLPPLPSLPRDRGTLLVAIASGIGVVVALATALLTGGIGDGGFRAQAEAPAVAPGGWLTLTGKDAPGHSKVLLESRRPGENWHSFGQGEADGHGDFAIRGRVLERPGRVQLRARVPGSTAATDPIPVTVRPLRLAAVGDINLDGASPKTWDSVGRALKQADLSFGNLESPVSKRGKPFPKEYNFRADPKALDALAARSGIDVLNLANNHTGDYGAAALRDTIDELRRHGIKGVGAGANLTRALQPRVVSRLGLRIAFVGFSEIAPIEFTAGADRPGTAWANPSEIAAAVRAARRKADIVVATFHWGIERQTLETARQRQLADYAVRAGAQVVIGAHPHTLQPVRRQGGAVVAYSLGNFVFPDARSPETTTTGILQLGLTADGVARAKWRAATIRDGRPLLDKRKAKRLPLRNSLRMQAGVNLPEL